MCCLEVPWVHRSTESLYENDTAIYDKENSVPHTAAVLLFLNSRTYGGGDNFVWDKAKSNDLQPSAPDDGLLEVINFHGKFNLGLEQVFPGRGSRVYQGCGPFVINFKDLDLRSRVYMQIDGEYFYANKPKCARVELSQISKDKLTYVLRKWS